MSWRLVATVLIALFAIITLSVTMAEPIRDVTDKIVDQSDNNQEVVDYADSTIRAWSDMILILIAGIMIWGGWRVLRREVTEGRL